MRKMKRNLAAAAACALAVSMVLSEKTAVI